MSKESVTVSIVVPVYNVGRYLPACVDSLLDQTFDDYEILLIDDGSTDNSPRICDHYEKRFGKVRVFHKNNGGLSDARNYGVKKAEGVFISFVDSDDCVSPHYIETLYSALRNTANSKEAIACGQILAVCENGAPLHWDRGNKNGFRQVSAAAFFSEIAADPCLVSACAKLAHKKLYEDNPFPYGMLYEDLSIIAKHVRHCSSVVMCDTSLYAYTKRTSSITRAKEVSQKQIASYQSAIEAFTEDASMTQDVDYNDVSFLTALQYVRLYELVVAFNNPELKKKVRHLVRLYFPNALRSSSARKIMKMRIAICALLPALYSIISRLRESKNR